ncbi:MAG TPA: hypothetical protein VFN10_02475 [Thermoanaerobaculia bacterium]|nr:hypothetical protein [Thermoanaerobaculia bacterium]
MSSQTSHRRRRRLLGVVVTKSFCLVPYRLRFRLVVAIARVAAFLQHRFFKVNMAQYRVDGPGEVMLVRAMDVLTRYGCEFEPELEFERHDLLEEGLAARHGVMVVGPHAMLNTLILRHVIDRGYPTVAFAAIPYYPVAGRREPMQMVQPSNVALLRARSALREGKIVTALIDRRSPNSSAIIFSDHLLKLGVLLEARVLFFSTRLDGAKVIMTFHPPALDALSAEFVAFTEEHRRRRSTCSCASCLSAIAAREAAAVT